VRRKLISSVKWFPFISLMQTKFPSPNPPKNHLGVKDFKV